MYGTLIATLLLAVGLIALWPVRDAIVARRAQAALAERAQQLVVEPSVMGVLYTPMSVRPYGVFAEVEYVQYDGFFEGRTSTGPFRVPYQVTAPRDPRQGNGVVVHDIAHGVPGAWLRVGYLGDEFMFTRGFTHVSVGYNTAQQGGILNSEDPSVFIAGGVPIKAGRRDDEINRLFAKSVRTDPVAYAMVGDVRHLYAMGFSGAAATIISLFMRLQPNGRSWADGTYDLLFPITVGGVAIAHPELADYREAVASGRYTGKIVLQAAEKDDVAMRFGFQDDGSAPHGTRYYVASSTSHAVDQHTGAARETTPASFNEELRARFLQAHRWVVADAQGIGPGAHPYAPPPSTGVARDPSAADGVARDANGHALIADQLGRALPRQPYVELAEARFLLGDFLGTVEDVKTLQQLGFASHQQYLTAFKAATWDYAAAVGLTVEDAIRMIRRAGCAPLTYTQLYMQDWETFATGGCVLTDQQAATLAAEYTRHVAQPGT